MLRLWEYNNNNNNNNNNSSCNTVFPRDIVCLENISMNTLHKGDDDDDDDNNNKKKKKKKKKKSRNYRKQPYWALHTHCGKY